ncbi:hypothetical protein JCM33374_g3374 [Metschnikowia sp. JCM 33374]|nr:hypothetical protein JCM33374_g3374 [Metschnikowia sp. JCM 33374]
MNGSNPPIQLILVALFLSITKGFHFFGNDWRLETRQFLDCTGNGISFFVATSAIVYPGKSNLPQMAGEANNTPDYNIKFHGISCGTGNAVFSPLKIASQLEVEIRKHLALYYAGWWVGGLLELSALFLVSL